MTETLNAPPLPDSQDAFLNELRTSGDGLSPDAVIPQAFEGPAAAGPTGMGAESQPGQPLEGDIIDASVPITVGHPGVPPSPASTGYSFRVGQPGSPVYETIKAAEEHAEYAYRLADSLLGTSVQSSANWPNVMQPAAPAVPASVRVMSQRPASYSMKPAEASAAPEQAPAAEQNASTPAATETGTPAPDAAAPAAESISITIPERGTETPGMTPESFGQPVESFAITMPDASTEKPAAERTRGNVQATARRSPYQPRAERTRAVEADPTPATEQSMTARLRNLYNAVKDAPLQAYAKFQVGIGDKTEAYDERRERRTKAVTYLMGATVVAKTLASSWAAAKGLGASFNGSALLNDIQDLLPEGSGSSFSDTVGHGGIAEAVDISPVTESLGQQGDTISHHALEHLHEMGNADPSQEQITAETQRYLDANHMSWEDAGHMAVGQTFVAPDAAPEVELQTAPHITEMSAQTDLTAGEQDAPILELDFDTAGEIARDELVPTARIGAVALGTIAAHRTMEGIADSLRNEEELEATAKAKSKAKKLAQARQAIEDLHKMTGK